MRVSFQPVKTNLTPVNVVGIPGLALTIIAFALALQFPEARWLIATGLAGGILVAAVLIAWRGRTSGTDGGGRSHGVLHVYDQTPSPTETPSRPSGPDTRHILVPAGA